MAIHREKDPFDLVEENVGARKEAGGSGMTDDNGNTDYSALISQSIKDGGSAYGVEKLLGQRTQKALGSDATKQYAYDDVYQAAMDYIGKGKDNSGFDYSSAPGYASKYQGKIDAMMQGLLNRPAFSYDHTKDPLYAQYEKAYTRNGERAMQDTIGEVSTRTGGLASSYAATAGQQTYDGYMDALGDKIPELQQLAYSMYRDEGNDKRANLEMLSALESGDYNKYADLLNQYNNDRNFNYGVNRDKVGDAWKDKEWQHGLDREESDDSWREKEWEHGLGREEIDDGRYEDETAYGKEQDALAWGYKNRSSSGGASGGGGGAPGEDYDALYAAAYASQNPKNYISSHYKEYGFKTSGGLSGGFDDWRESESENGQKLHTNDFSVLLSYTKKAIDKAGRSPEYMYDALKKQGYGDEVIDQVFAALGL